jgi:hypothetical protein
MRTTFAWIVTATFVAGLVGSAFAQTTPPAGTQAPATTPAPKPAAPATGGASTAAPAAKKAAMKPPVTGTVKTAAPDSLVLVTMDKDKKEKEWAFVLDKDTTIKQGDKKVEAKDLKEKDTATVAYKEADGKMIATTVTLKPAKKKA